MWKDLIMTNPKIYDRAQCSQCGQEFSGPRAAGYSDCITHQRETMAKLKESAGKIRTASVVIGNLPELPGYNGSILIIDDKIGRAHV